MQPLLNLHTWVSLPNDVRIKFREIFKIPRSESTLVSDNQIVSDGTTPQDISHLTIEKMQRYLDSTETDFNKLFLLTKDKIEGKTITTNVTTDAKEEPQENKQDKKTSRKRNTA